MTAFFCGVDKTRHGSAHLKFPAVSWVSAHLKAGSCSGKICVAHSALRHVDFRSTSCDCVIEHLATFVKRKFCSIASEYIPYYTGWCQEAVLSSVKAPRIFVHLKRVIKASLQLLAGSSQQPQDAAFHFPEPRLAIEAGCSQLGPACSMEMAPRVSQQQGW